MRTGTRIVPAEVISVEDRLVGWLSLVQAGLLGLPLGLAGLLLLASPRLEVVAYKVLLVGAVGLVCGSLAVRVRDRLAGDWLLVGRRYAGRPRRWLLGTIPDSPVRGREGEQS